MLWIGRESHPEIWFRHLGDRDMHSESARAEAMQRAAETGRTAISGKVKLVQEIEG